MAINEWVQYVAAGLIKRSAERASNPIERLSYNINIEYVKSEGYGMGGSIDDIPAALASPPRWCLCEECRDRRMFIDTRLSGLFVVCLGCGNVPIPRNRLSGHCVVCEEQHGYE